MDNYRIFRERMAAPLLTIELGYHDNFELRKNDATHLIQLRADHVMWQKERLLNVARAELPDECEFVVWLDCDVVFERQDWLEATVDSLRESVLIQPYSVVCDLKRDADIPDTTKDGVLLERQSMAWQYRKGTINFNSTSTSMLGHYSPGHAWAIRREAMEGPGFYDAMILGSGDFAMAMAAVGRYDDIAKTYAMNPQQAKHYRSWAKEWNRAIGGSIGVVEGALYHLWHGELGDRGYDRRYASLEQFEFDPFKDIAIDMNGCWRWSSNKIAFHEYVQKYFESRREDGTFASEMRSIE